SQGSAVGGKQRTEAGIRHPRRALTLVDNVSREPRASVRDCEETAAAGVHHEAGPAAEVAGRRREHQSAPELQASEALQVWTAAKELGDGPRRDVDRLRVFRRAT